jgi:NAD(P)-dependent dehydrogenase (short-subunit alcohol dehydrogenase family)
MPDGTPSDTNPNGLRALVTGGASGIGSAIASRLVREGMAVAILDRSAPADDGRPPGVPFFRADVTNDHDVRQAVDAAARRLGGLDVLVNNAGIGAQGTVEDNDDDEWLRVLDVNVVGMARVSRAAWPHLRRSSHAAIVNMASVAAVVGLPRRAVYTASKGAVLALTLAMAADGLPDGIRVNAVCPGTTDTPWVARLLDRAADPGAERAALVARQPHGRLVTADEVAAAAWYFAAPESCSTTGTSLVVDGGLAGLRLPSPPAPTKR